MPRLKFKKKCALCKDKMATIISFSQFPVCDSCQMKRIKGSIAEKEYEFLNIDDKLYRESYFLRNIKGNYLRYGHLSEKQVAAFKKVVKEMQQEKKEERKEQREEKKREEKTREGEEKSDEKKIGKKEKEEKNSEKKPGKREEKSGEKKIGKKEKGEKEEQKVGKKERKTEVIIAKDINNYTK